MKTSRIIIFVLILIIGWLLWLNMHPKEVVAPTVVETETPAIVPTTTEAVPEEHGMTPEEEAAMLGESDKGSDIGMEMPTPDMPIDSFTKTFEVTAEDFAYNLKEIRVQEGDTVIIKFKSIDGFHDWVLDEFDARTAKVKTGGESQVIFLANKAGTFEYYCSVGSHRANGMVGTLIVE
jgi:plastocyanin